MFDEILWCIILLEICFNDVLIVFLNFICIVRNKINSKDMIFRVLE